MRHKKKTDGTKTLSHINDVVQFRKELQYFEKGDVVISYYIISGFLPF